MNFRSRKILNSRLISQNALLLSVDTNIQFLIREELIKYNRIFSTLGSAAILMDVNNGEISMVSTPDYDLNKRKLIEDEKFINRITKRCI